MNKLKRIKQKHSNGFTLAELIVTIAILGIITMMALPGIKNLQENNAQRKYKEYAKILITGAKLYIDSYTEDIFGNNISGCYDIKLKDMLEKNLVNDIRVDNATCEDSYVRVVKAGDIYSYRTSVYCKDKDKNTKIYEEKIKLVEGETSCKADEPDNTGPAITISPGSSLEVSYKTNGWLNKSAADKINNGKGKVKVTVSDKSGLMEGQKLKYAWGLNDVAPAESSYSDLFFSNEASSQEKQVLTKSNYINFPSNYNGKYKLYIKGEYLKDILGNITTGNINYGETGLFLLDNTKPNCDGFNGQNTNWTKNKVTITSKCSDPITNGTASSCEENPSQSFSTGTVAKQNLTFTIKDKATNTNTCTINQASIYFDGNGPTKPTSGKIGAVSGSNPSATIGTASGSTDTSNSTITYMYCLKQNNNTVPTKNDECFTTTRTYTRTCGTSYHAWAIAVDQAGNRSDVYDMGSTSDGASGYSAFTSCSAKCKTNASASSPIRSKTSSCLLEPTITENCNNVVCCSTGNVNYKDGGSCTKACGGGTYNRLAYSNFDGSRCPTFDTSSGGSACGTGTCCSSGHIRYENGTSCTKSCGSGTYNRIAYSSYDGSRCSSFDTTSGGSACNTQACCSSGHITYKNGTSCSASCDGGTYNRIAYSAYDGSRCSAYDTSTGGSACNTGSCSPHINCWRDGTWGVYHSDNGKWQYGYGFYLPGYINSTVGGAGNTGVYQTGYGALVYQNTIQWYWERSTWVSGQQGYGRDPGTGKTSNWCQP